ncbi:MAG: hypothetical protein ACRCTA_05135, partial [Bacilli bacterium]
IAFTLALSLSSLFSQKISKAIIDTSKSSLKEDDNQANYQPNIAELNPDLGNSIDPNYIVNNYKIKLDNTSIIIIYVIAFVTLSSATIVPMSYVLNLNPKKILM